MNIIKYKTSKGWISLYQSFMNSFIRKSKNLSDLDDKNQARVNLELTGDDNHTHFHDDRYVPMITQAKDSVMAEIDQAKNELNVRIDTLKTTTTDNTTIIKSKMDSDMIVVGSIAPNNPKDGTAWFYINTENKQSYIKVWYNGQWNNMGAFWK